MNTRAVPGQVSISGNRGGSCREGKAYSSPQNARLAQRARVKQRPRFEEVGEHMSDGIACVEKSHRTKLSSTCSKTGADGLR